MGRPSFGGAAPRRLRAQATRALLPVLGLAVPPLRGLLENLYVFYEPYLVDHRASAADFGDGATPLREATRQTVAWARSRGDRATGALPGAPARARS